MTNPVEDIKNECPAKELLERVTHGAASAAEDAEIESHLNVCEACRQRFEAVLENEDDWDDLADIDLDHAQSDLEALRAAGIPPLPKTEAVGDHVTLPGGLRLALPRRAPFLARLGEYDVLSVIGQGGMGFVLKAWEESLRREVALKVMTPRWIADQVARERFLQEARSAARLRHPNILTIHAVGEDAGVPYIAMEYVRGKSLSLLLAEEGRIEPVRAARIIRQVLAALEHAHREGIVHRDIKPANILLDEEGERVCLVDFGLACGLSESVRYTAEGTVVGTPWYMSPEQAAGLPHQDPRSDLFSLGAVLFEMLLGVLPFPGLDVQGVLEQVRSSETPDPCEFNPAIPRRLADILKRSLQKNRVLRYQSAGEFAEAIDAYLAEAEEKSLGAQLPVSPSAYDKTILRCSACSRTIVSEMSVAGECDECRSPLCAKCWTIDGRRRCRNHEEKPRDHESPKAAGQQQPSAPASSRPASVQSAASSTPPPVAPPVTPLVQELSVSEKIAQTKAAGRPAISAAEASVAEETFFRIVANTLASLGSIPDPLRGATVSVKNWAAIARRSDELSSSAAGKHRQSPEACPRGAIVSYDLRQRNWRGENLGLARIEVRSLAHWQSNLQEGYDDQPVTRRELEQLCNATARRAREAEIWHLLILYSPTGWNAEAKDFAAGRGRRGFHDLRVSVVLFDDSSAHFLMSETDEKLAALRDAFSPDLDETAMNRARQFLDDYLRLHDSVALETLVEQLGLSRRAAERLHRLLLATGHYVSRKVDAVGVVLAKNR